MKRVYVSTILATLAVAATACKKDKGPEKKQPTPEDPVKVVAPTADEARAFLAEVDKGLREVWVKRDLADWERSTNITPETEAAAAKASEEAMAYLTRSIKGAQKFAPVMDQLDDATRRQF